MKITSQLFEAFLKCPTKCYLRSQGEIGSGNEYAEWVRAQNESYERKAVRRMEASIPETERVAAPPVTENFKTAQWRLAVNLTLQTLDRSADIHFREFELAGQETRGLGGPRSGWQLESRLHAVERVPAEGRGRPTQFVPIRLIFRNKLTTDDRLLLAFDALVLSQALGREISLGKIIHGDDHTTLKVKPGARTAESARTAATSKGLAAEVRKRLDKITALFSGQAGAQSATVPRGGIRESSPDEETRGLSGPRSGPTPPDLVLNRNCAECEFRDRCRQKAIETDDLSLLAGMSAKERQKLRSKGIFTVTQLSYTFRPRRRPKRLRDKREKYHHSLKALAIREQKIHIVGSPELKIEGTPVYLDVEGLPDRDFYYLIGLRIGHGESAVQHSLWADTVADEGKIWREFLALLETVEQPVLIHYGSYETTFLKAMKERHGKPPDESVAAKALGSAINLVSVMFAQIYFPTYSNSLKDTAGWLGYGWSASNATGTQTIIWRHRWECSRETDAKGELITYNAQDCEALGIIMAMVQRLKQTDTEWPSEGNRQSTVVSVDSLGEQPWLFQKFASPIVELEIINKAARWNYQRERIYVRSDEKIRRAYRQQKKSRVETGQVNKVILHQNVSVCPKCHRRTKLRKNPPSTLHDIQFGRFGIKRWIVTYQYCSAWCPRCNFYSGRPSTFRLHSQYGRNLIAFVVFQVIGLCIPQRTVAEFLDRVFGLRIPECTVNGFKASAARHYDATRQKILAEMVKGKLIHADETRIVLKGKPAYVWVFATFREVVYFYSETREGDLLEKLLNEFKGVLVSDFYAAYDSMPCAQQKCLIHLMRDLNDAVLDHPFDEEVRGIVTQFGEILRSIVSTIDRRGLKHHFLRKHGLEVERFYRHMRRTTYHSEAALKCKERFEKSREKLFTFLNHDGVPWNNNNVEHAIKAFARLRRAIEGLSTPKGIEEYLILLSVCQTCKYMGVDFLDFLRSGEKDIHVFAESRGGRRRRTQTSQTNPLPPCTTTDEVGGA